VLRESRPHGSLGGFLAMTVPVPSPAFPSYGDVKDARKCARTLTAHSRDGADAQQMRVLDRKGQPHAMDMPPSGLRLLLRILNEIGQGNMPHLQPIPAELTAEQAADLLGIPHADLAQLLDEGKIASRGAGAERRIRYEDLVLHASRSQDEAGSDFAAPAGKAAPVHDGAIDPREPSPRVRIAPGLLGRHRSLAGMALRQGKSDLAELIEEGRLGHLLPQRGGFPGRGAAPSSTPEEAIEGAAGRRTSTVRLRLAPFGRTSAGQ